MKINGFQNIPAVLQSIPADKTLKSQAGSGARGSASEVSLSSFAELMQSLQRSSAQSASVRNARVEQLSQKDQSGKLSVDFTQLASKLVDLNVIDTKG